MILNLKELKRGRFRVSQEVVMPDWQKKDSGLVGRVECSAVVDALQWQFHVQLVYSCILSLQCARCLRWFEQKIEGEFRLLLQNKNAPDSALDDEEVDFYYGVEDDEVDMRSALYDEIMISVPIMPLCSEYCKGVQIEKGKRSNGGGNKDQECDPRWEALKKLKK